MLFNRSSLGRAVGLYFDKDGGAGGGVAKDDAPKTDDGAGGEDAEKAGKKKKDVDISFTPEQQAVVDLLVGDARTKERAKAKGEIDAETAKAKKKAEEDALKDKEEWKTLADKRQADLEALAREKAELEPFKEQADKYRKALDGQLAKVKEKLPKYLLPLIEKMDPVEAMAYITEHAEELGAKPSTYSETPEGREKKVSDEDKKKAEQASSNLITRTF